MVYVNNMIVSKSHIERLFMTKSIQSAAAVRLVTEGQMKPVLCTGRQNTQLPPMNTCAAMVEIVRPPPLPDNPTPNLSRSVSRSVSLQTTSYAFYIYSKKICAS